MNHSIESIKRCLYSGEGSGLEFKEIVFSGNEPKTGGRGGPAGAVSKQYLEAGGHQRTCRVGGGVAHDELPMAVFVAASGCAAHVEPQWKPNKRALTVSLDALPTGGSVIFAEATGQVPGLRGTLNPMRDAHDRTYLFAQDIAVNDGARQPVHYYPGETLRLTDVDGTKRQVKIVAAEGRSALLEYDVAHQGDDA